MYLAIGLLHGLTVLVRAREDGGLTLRPMAMRVRLGVLAIEATVGT